MYCFFAVFKKFVRNAVRKMGLFCRYRGCSLLMQQNCRRTVKDFLLTYVGSCRKRPKHVTTKVWQKITVPIRLAENVKNVPEYAEILCKSVQIFQKGRKSSTLYTLRKLWEVVLRLLITAITKKDRFGDLPGGLVVFLVLFSSVRIVRIKP